MPVSRRKTLEEVWRFDAVPEAMRKARYGKLTYTNRHGTAEAPRADQPLQANIIAAPVFHDGKVYVGLGRDHNYGIAPGVLWCIDASRTGELDESAAVWKVDQEIKTTMCAVAIADGLCYYVDSAGQLFCFDAETGRKYWKHELGAGVYYGEPLVADGKVFVTTEKDHVVLKAGKETEELFRTNARGAEGRTMACLDGILFVPTNRQLAAYGAPRAQ